MALLIGTNIPDHLVDRLRMFNLRTVEQLLLIRRDARKVSNLARAMHITKGELDALLGELAGKYSDLEVKSIGFKPRPLGYRIAGGKIS